MTKTRLVNLHDHEITIWDRSGRKVLLRLAPSYQRPFVRHGSIVEEEVEGIPILKQQVEIANMPAPQEGVLYIVPYVIQAALAGIRTDLVSADTRFNAKWDDKTNLKDGCRALVRVGGTMYLNGQKAAPPPAVVDEWDDVPDRVKDLMDFPGGERYLFALGKADSEYYLWYVLDTGAPGAFLLRKVEYTNRTIATAPGKFKTERAALDPVDTRFAVTSPAKLMEALRAIQPDIRRWRVIKMGEEIQPTTA